MALTGQLNDLSLSELIEFFCNQRKTGRLKVDYALAPGVFFINEGELVDAKLGALNGVDAIYFALTLPSAAFDFSAHVQSSRRTINEPWTRVVLEGLRRIDEGLPASDQDPFSGLGNEELDEAVADYLSCVEAATAHNAPQPSKPAPSAPPKADAPAPAQSVPLSLTVEATGDAAGSKRKFVVAGVMAAVLLACVVAAVPLARHFARGNAAVTAGAPAPAPATNSTTADSTSNQPDATVAPTPDAVAAEDAAIAARRQERERELRLQRERERKLDEARKGRAASTRRTDARAGRA